MSSIEILNSDKSCIISCIKFNVEPYETTVISLPELIISISPTGVLISARFEGSFSLTLGGGSAYYYAYNYSRHLEVL